MARIKGFVVRGVLKYVKESGHAGGVGEVVAAIHQPARAHFQSQILSAAWYPYEALAGLVDAVERCLGDGSFAIMPEIGRQGARREAGTVFRVVTTFLSAESLVKFSPIVWRQTCDTGELEIVTSQRGHVVAALTGFPTIAEGHCHMISGWVEGMASAVGGQEPTAVKVGCVHRGDADCRYEITWQGQPRSGSTPTA